jgi:hypothetical protein
MKRKITRIIPADHSPESIRNVTTIVINSEKNGFSIDATIVHLEGTVEEKLQQYKEATGKDWTGYSERVFSEMDHGEPTSLNLGQQPLMLLKSKEDQEVQDKIDALVVQAKQWLRENKIAQQKKKLLTARARVKQETT